MTPKRLAVYVHIPFCERKCLYCDFNSGVYGPDTRSRYVEGLLADIRATPVRGTATSVFIGGGTPSVLPAASLARILDAVRDRFEVSADAEITVECNPGTVASERMAGETTASFLHGLRDAGVNRLSIGVQSFDPGVLRRLGRIHGPEQAAATVLAAREADFDNINLDLMFALPGQTQATWSGTLQTALAMDVPHLSCYSLIVEPGTPFHAWDAGGLLVRPDNDEEAVMYETCIRTLETAGYEHYEVSSFARRGRRCRHNQVYWRNEEYVGFGAGAASYVDGVRYTRKPALDDYLRSALAGADTVSEREALDVRGRMGETMMLGLRLMEGVSRADFAARFGADPFDVWPAGISRLESRGLLAVTPERIALTRRGLLVANDVWEEFVTD